MRALSWPLSLLFALAGCERDPRLPGYEFLPEMVDSVPYDSFDANSVFQDGKTLRPPVPGTIARGQRPNHVDLDGGNPLPLDQATLEIGEKRFASFCSPCHGIKGEGDGPLIPKFPTPPSLTAAHARALADGRLFHIVSHGQATMPGHAIQISPQDRWRIVHFLRRLQGQGPEGDPR